MKIEKIKPRGFEELPVSSGIDHLVRMDPIDTDKFKEVSTMQDKVQGKPVFNSKPIWASKTLWGVVFMFLGWFLKKQGISLDLEPLKDFVHVTLEDGVFYLGAFLAALGRMTASSRVVLWPSRKGKEKGAGSQDGGE